MSVIEFRDRVKALEEALKPFAAAAELIERQQLEWLPDTCPLLAQPSQSGGPLTVGDLRRAQEVLKTLRAR